MVLASRLSVTSDEAVLFVPMLFAPAKLLPGTLAMLDYGRRQ
jgi:hypothetical protein